MIATLDARVDLVNQPRLRVAEDYLQREHRPLGTEDDRHAHQKTSPASQASQAPAAKAAVKSSLLAPVGLAHADAGLVRMGTVAEPHAGS